MAEAFILIVEDDDVTCGLLVNVLEQEGHRCVVASGNLTALEDVKSGHFDLVIYDIERQGGGVVNRVDGNAMARLASDAPIVLLVSPHTGPASLERAPGIAACVTKPVAPFALRLAVEGALQRRSLQRENLQLRSALTRAGANTQGRAADADWPTLEILQARYVERVLAKAEGNRTHAARILGLDRRTVQRLVARTIRAKE
jgi:DNA-binding NtrC family response regulator